MHQMASESTRLLVNEAAAGEKPLLAAADDDNTPLLGVAPVQRSSLLQASLNLTQNTLGPGCLSLPAGFALAGFAAGLSSLLIVCVISTLMLLIIAWAQLRTRSPSAQDLVLQVVGPRMAFASRIIILGYMWSGQIMSLVYVADNFRQVLLLFAPSGVWYTDQKFVISCCCVLIGALSMFRRLSALSYLSAFGIVLVLYAAGFVVVEGLVFLSQNPVHPPVVAGVSNGVSFIRCVCVCVCV